MTCCGWLNSLENPVKEILDGLDHLHGKYVHTWFMEQYIDYGEYEFRDEWLVDGYCVVKRAETERLMPFSR